MAFQQHYWAGLEHLRAGRLEAAAMQYLAAIAADPGDPDAHCDLGVVYKRQGCLPEAVDELELALRLVPGHANSQTNLLIIRGILEHVSSEEVLAATQAVQELTERPVAFDGISNTSSGAWLFLFLDSGPKRGLIIGRTHTSTTTLTVSGMQLTILGTEGKVKYVGHRSESGDWTVMISGDSVAGAPLEALITTGADASVAPAMEIVRAVLERPELDLRFRKMTFDQQQANTKTFDSSIGVVEVATRRVEGATEGQVLVRETGQTIHFRHDLQTGAVHTARPGTLARPVAPEPPRAAHRPVAPEPPRAAHRPAAVCQRCGAENHPLQTVCRQCHGSLTPAGATEGLAAPAGSVPASRAPARPSAPQAVAPLGLGSRCQECGEYGDTWDVVFRQTIGAVVVRLSKKVEGRLCRGCAARYFWQFSLVTLFLGWWGVVSAILTPFLLLANIASYVPTLAKGKRAVFLTGLIGIPLVLGLWLGGVFERPYRRSGSLPTHDSRRAAAEPTSPPAIVYSTETIQRSQEVVDPTASLPEREDSPWPTSTPVVRASPTHGARPEPTWTPVDTLLPEGYEPTTIPWRCTGDDRWAVMEAQLLNEWEDYTDPSGLMRIQQNSDWAVYEEADLDVSFVTAGGVLLRVLLNPNSCGLTGDVYSETAMDCLVAEYTQGVSNTLDVETTGSWTDCLHPGYVVEGTGKTDSGDFRLVCGIVDLGYDQFVGVVYFVRTTSTEELSPEERAWMRVVMSSLELGK